MPAQTWLQQMASGVDRWLSNNASLASPARKSARASRDGSPPPTPAFTQAQTKWLSEAMTGAMGTFGEFVDKRFETLEAKVQSHSDEHA
eukprot:8908871-Alexandrium_andersonii.AAC.1